MKPVISPWLFYCFHLVDGFICFLVFAGVVAFAYGAVKRLMGRCEGGKGPDAADVADMKAGKKWMLIGITLFVIGMLIPPRRVIVKMWIAHELTYERLGRREEKENRRLRVEVFKAIEDIVRKIENQEQEQHTGNCDGQRS